MDTIATTDRAATVPASLVQRLATAAGRPVPAASFVAFRVAFGVLVAYSSLRFLARGWVGEFYVSPEHHLTYPRFEWVAPLPAPWMHVHVVALATLGVMIAAGVRYRAAAALFAIGFAYTELLDAALYLNHYWFVTLAAIVLAVAPTPSDGVVPRVSVWSLRAQLAVVYVFAGLAKLNPDWLLEAQPMQIWLGARTDRPLVGAWLDEPAVAYALSWAGAAFDLTIVGWLSWRRSRPFAYAVVVCFHVATAMLFQIGVFPWVMIALTPIFFEPDWPRRLHARLLGHPAGTGRDEATRAPQISRWSRAALAALVAANLVLPLRHYAADGNVRFNDDGYYLSWRVMLTERTGFVEFTAFDPSSGATWTYRPDDVLTEWQAAQATRRPDLILATAHVIADELAERGHDDLRVTADAWVSFNGRQPQRWVDPTVDLAALPRTAPAARYVLPDDPPVTE